MKVFMSFKQDLVPCVNYQKKPRTDIMQIENPPTSQQFIIALFVIALCTGYVIGSGMLDFDPAHAGENESEFGLVFWMAASGLAFLFSVGLHLLLNSKKRSMEEVGKISEEERMLEPFYGAKAKEKTGVVLSVALLGSLPVLIVYFAFTDLQPPWQRILVTVTGITVLMIINIYAVILFKKSREFYERYELILVPTFLYFISIVFYKYALSLQDLSLPAALSPGNIAAVLYAIAAIPLGVKLLLSANRTIFDKKARAEDELQFASEVQKQFLNDRTVSTDTFSAFGTSRTARQVGGDFLYLDDLDDGSIVAAVGDVSGHSFGAGLIMSMLVTMTEDYIYFMKSPKGLMENLNRKLLNQPKRNLFATMGCIQLTGEKAKIWNAGHMPVLKQSQYEDELIKIKPAGFALGMTGQATYQPTEVQLQPGDYLVLYSDGLVETRDAEGQVRDENHFYETVKSVLNKGGPCDFIATSILEKVLEDDFSDYPEDDLTIVVIQKQGEFFS
jgi:serine phosphatase RsbU (regulator of sigma subunit)